ncbi:MAG: hypothetical protein HFI70_14420 [Lachnospiraceae bacterium]|nr:hypothetical protein [Lachnospiraceae bacterium]
MKMKIYIWGTGKIASAYLKKNELKADDIIGFIETKKSKDFFFDKKVYEPHEIAANEDYDYMIVCAGDGCGREIYDTCVKLKISTDKLILVDNWEWADGNFREICQNNIDVKKLFPLLYEEIKMHGITEKYVITGRNTLDLTKKTLMISQQFLTPNYQGDYFRYRTFELAANEIIKQEIEGNTAELGVFQGVFSAFINAKFHDRKLYLFDTFESFDPDEAEREIRLGRCNEALINNFKNTSVESVMKKMAFPGQCIVRKGLFPDTAIGLENETYAFVSIDVDFEKSMLEGLRYFYPRVNTGGAIFVHDFNSSSLEGVRIAVETYENEIGKMLCKVPLADQCGTLVIMKP